MKIYRTLAHELSHDLVMLKEDKGELHSNDKDREELIKLSNPSTNGIKDEEKVLSVAYFPIQLTRREVLKLADEEMNNCPPEKVKLKGEKDNEGEDDKYKIYIYYDKESPIRDQLKSELCDRRGFKEKKNPINLRKRMILDQEIDDNNLVGYCGYQGDDRFDEIEPQIQIPPKSNNN
ncbi:20634_t:CDS:2 [Funneliformis geosporum]|nr:20634_t:CDS:2 [Funneliformis geosporum]